MELKFEKLEEECKQCAEDFIDELKLLTIFLNYYPDVRLKWLYEIGMVSSEMTKIDKVADYYAKKKVELENKLKPQTKKEVVEVEDKILREMYVGKIFKIYEVSKPEKIAEFLVRSEYRNCAIILPEQLAQLEKTTMFSECKKKFPMSFLIFDPENLKIIGIEAVPA